MGLIFVSVIFVIKIFTSRTEDDKKLTQLHKLLLIGPKRQQERWSKICVLGCFLQCQCAPVQCLCVLGIYIYREGHKLAETHRTKVRQRVAELMSGYEFLAGLESLGQT